MILERIPWTCVHDCPLRLLVLSLYLWGEISEELGDAWELAGRPRPEGYISEFKGAQFVQGYEKIGFYYGDKCYMPVDVLEKEMV